MAVIKVRDKEGNIITVPTLSGESAYDIAVRKGYAGTEEEWIAQVQSPADWDAADGITQILNKPTKLSQFDGELTSEEQSLIRERIGAGTSNFSGDYNDLTNKPVREATAKISWDGNISGITTVANSDGLINSENVGQELSYYLMSDLIVDSSKALNGTFTLVENSPHTFNTTQDNIFYSDGSSNGTFYLSDSNIGGTPIVYCVNEDCSDANPLVFDATSCSIGAHTITFTKPGIYFIKFNDTTYVSGFTTSDEKQLDEKLIPDTIQRKLDYEPLAFGLCDEEGYIINYFNGTKNNDITKAVYNLKDENGVSFMLPFQALQSLDPPTINESIIFKIPTKINSFTFNGEKDVPEYISISIGANKSIIEGNIYTLIAYKYLDNWNGFLSGKLEREVDKAAQEGSTNLITSGAIYTEIQETKTFAEEIAEGKCKTYVFDTTIADTEENFKAYIEKYKAETLTDGPLYGVDSNGNEIKLKTGDILLLVQTNLPDYWWDEEAQDVHELEMSKLALSEYVKTTQLDTKLSEYTKTADLANNYATKGELTSSSNSLQNSISNISSIKIGETSYSLRILEGNDDGGQAGYITFVI